MEARSAMASSSPLAFTIAFWIESAPCFPDSPKIPCFPSVLKAMSTIESVAPLRIYTPECVFPVDFAVSVPEPVSFVETSKRSASSFFVVR